MDWKYSSLVQQAYNWKVLHLCGPLFAPVRWANVLLIMDGQFYVSIIGLEKAFLYNSVYKAE